MENITSPITYQIKLKGDLKEKNDRLLVYLSHSKVSSDHQELQETLATLQKKEIFPVERFSHYLTVLANEHKILLFNLGSELCLLEDIRLAGSKLGRYALTSGLKEVEFLIPENMKSLVSDTSELQIAQTFAEGFWLGAFERKTYHQDKKYSVLEQVTFTVSEEQQEAWTKSLEISYVLAQGVHLARDLVNLPGNYLTPQGLADHASKVASTLPIEVEILEETQIQAKNMGGLWNVGKASINPPRMITLEYKGDPASSEKIALVGKGITFDTGGISLKRPQNMEDMISDMGGAASVLGVMHILGTLKPKINVIGVIPTAENMPGGRALKPGDVITTMSGRTVEVINTDAEGRLVLADGMTYAKEKGATKFFDIATLTGAALISLGEIATLAVTNSSEMYLDFEKTSFTTGENVWLMPSYGEFKDMIKSEVADIKNSAGRDGGSITAGLFVGTFADDAPFIHLDIAGTAFLSKARGVNPKGGTGVMVRTLARYLISKSV